MNPLTPQLLAHALGWILLHFLWQGALIALILACMLALLGDRDPQPRYLAACTALLLMVATPIATFTRIVTQDGRAHRPITLIQRETVKVTATGAPSQSLLQRVAATFDHAMPTVLTLWLAGVILLLARLILGLIVARRMKSVATQLPPYDLLAAFHQLARRIGVSRPVQLFNSALVQVPTVIGWLRPVVLIPFGCLAGLSPAQIEAILAHELAHIRRHDYLISVLQSIVEALLFYHPAVWWISRRLRIEREHCCDDLAVQIGGDPLTYARALSLLAEQSAVLPTIALAANGGVLTRRIKRLLTPKPAPATSQLAAASLLTLVLLATGLCIATAARAQYNPAQNHTQNKPASKTSTLSVLTQNILGPEMAGNNTPSGTRPSSQQAVSSDSTGSQYLKPEYEAWLDQDVRWLIDPRERSAFLQLISDEERDHFIQQFWEARNPAGAAPNSARTEHYQRIANANQQYGKSGIPGWQTDRGRIYIMNGAPSSVDSHPGTTEEHPFEIWHFSAVSGSDRKVNLKFVDICSCGNYQLQPQPGTSSSRLTAQAPMIEMSEFISSSNPNTGTVVLIGMTAPDGHIYDVRAISGPPMLQARAIESVKHRFFQPLPTSQPPATDVPTKITVDFIFDSRAVSHPSNITKPAVKLASFQQQPAATKPISVSAGVIAGKKISGITPIYPPAAKSADIQGVIVLQAVISKTGDIASLEPISGPKELRASTLTAVRTWKYKPYLLNGEPQQVSTIITVRYNLAGEDPGLIYTPGTQPPPPTPVAGPSTGPATQVTPKKVGGAVSAPRLLYSVEPNYSQQAKEDKIDGKVIVGLWVDEQGKPTHVRVLRGIGHGLDERAIEAVQQYKFSPALEEGKPVTVQINVEINFQLF